MKTLYMICAIPLTIWKGFAIKLLWGWFIVPLGFPVIGLLWAIGISLVISLFTTNYKEALDFNYSESFTFSLVSPGVAILLGLIVQALM